ncbi:MAG TPA: LptA/OstA family protein, partial [Candidatus Binataceae bacterium]|nr:LptA/OstA family protein [Candidatus Binataceae bacterium]
ATPPTGEVSVPAAPATPAEQPSGAAAGGSSPVTAPPGASTAPSAGKGAEGQAAGGSGGASAGNQADTKGAANASPFSALASPSNGPIKIKSDTLSVDYKKNSALWRGHVHAVRADGELSSETLQVIYGKDFHELQQMIASGNVRISRGTQWSVSDHAVLNEANQTVVLTGNPVVHDGNDQITGSKITVYLKTGESVVEGAKAVIFPRQGKTRDNGVSADHAR